MAFQLLVNLVGQAQTRIIHREKEPLYFKPGIQFRLDDADGVKQFADSLQCEIFRLHRDNYRIGSRKGVDRYQPQRRRTVNQHIVIFRRHGTQQTRHHLFPVRLVNQLKLGTGKVDTRPYEVETFDTCSNLRPVDRILIDQAFINRRLHLPGVDTVARCCVSLGVGINYKHTLPKLGKRCSKIDGGGGFSHPPLLICYCDDFTHFSSLFV